MKKLLLRVLGLIALFFLLTSCTPECDCSSLQRELEITEAKATLYETAYDAMKPVPSHRTRNTQRQYTPQMMPMSFGDTVIWVDPRGGILLHEDFGFIK